MSDVNKLIESGRIIERKKLSMLEEIQQKLQALSCDNTEIQQMLQDVIELGKETLELFNELLDGFDKLKNSNAEMEEKLLQMSKKLDELRNAIPDGDYAANEILCKQKYSAVWSKLDQTSKSFLVTASYLCKRCVGENLDFSPMIVEMSRAYENELLEKIFRDFIMQNASKALLAPNGKKDALYNAISDVKNGNTFFVSLTQMIKIMNSLPSNAKNTYVYKLNTDLYPNWHTKKLADRSFYTKGITYATDYRNRAAHPGTTLNKTDADNCEQLSQLLLNHFIGAMK